MFHCNGKKKYLPSFLLSNNDQSNNNNHLNCEIFCDNGYGNFIIEAYLNMENILLWYLVTKSSWKVPKSNVSTRHRLITEWFLLCFLFFVKWECFLRGTAWRNSINNCINWYNKVPPITLCRLAGLDLAVQSRKLWIMARTLDRVL